MFRKENLKFLLLLCLFPMTLLVQAQSKIPKPKMVHVKGGTFIMGSIGEGKDEQPLHEVKVSSFYIGTYEVTAEDFSLFIQSTNYQTNADIKKGIFYWENEKWLFKSNINWRYNEQYQLRPDTAAKKPIIFVSWYDAIRYCNWLSKKHKLDPVYTVNKQGVIANWQANGYRLPTESEWEYAATSRGKGDKWSGTSVEEEIIYYGNRWLLTEEQEDGFIYTAPVGSFKPNGLGIYDMSGNVWEWCWDWYGSNYYNTQEVFVNPKGPDNGIYKVQKGGSWKSGPNPTYLRCSFRGYFSLGDSEYSIGFRLAKNVD